MLFTQDELKEAVAIVEDPHLIYSSISSHDKLNMPPFVMGFKLEKTSTPSNAIKYGQSLDSQYFQYIPTDAFLQQKEFKFFRHGKKPFICHKTDDGWCFIGKFDRPFAPPFNGEPYILKDKSSGDKLAEITLNDLPSKENPLSDEFLEGITDFSLALIKGEGISANLFKDIKILKKGKKPLREGFILWEYETIKEVLKNDPRIPHKEFFKYVDTYIIPAEGEVSPNMNIDNIMVIIEMIKASSLNYFLRDHFKPQLLVDREDDEE